MSNRIGQTGLLGSMGIAFALFFASSCSGLTESGGGDATIPIEAAVHHLGNDAGSEGVVFEKELVVDTEFSRAILEFDFVLPAGPNLESPPIVSINGVDAGSVQPFFPPVDTSDPRWQTNPDGSHDYNGVIHVSLPATQLVVVGTNTFRIENGRFDDDYWFANVRLTVETQP